MRQVRHYIVFLMLAALMLGCTGSGTHSDEGRRVGRTPQPSDTLYTKETAMDVYASDLDRALLIIDSAEIVGNMSADEADLLRAKVYAWTCEEINYDTAILICERLMLQKSMMEDLDTREDVLGILLNVCRMRKDYEQALYWATELDDLYYSRGEQAEALRTDAEIGALLVRIGQQEEGLSKIDSVIRQLDGKRKFNEMDALIIALRRKAEICLEKELFIDVIAAAQNMLNLLDDYERHPADYHDGSFREPSENDRPEYIDFYRGKAYAYLMSAYASLGENAKAREYLALYDQTVAGQSFTGRFMIVQTLRILGEYDRVLAVYDEVEQHFGTDTLNENYLEILRGRAEIFGARGNCDEAQAIWKRYVVLNEQLTENLLQGKAHLYAARFHASEQQREIERQREATHRVRMSRRVIGIICLLILLFALFAIRQWYKTQKHNQILAQQITDAVKYKEKYKELKRSVEATHTCQKEDSSLSTPNSKPTTNNSQLPTNNSKLPTENSKLPTENSSDADLFAYLRDLIEREQLFLNPQFERQTLINRTGLSKERIGAAFAQGSGHERLTTLVREMRLDYAVRLMNEQPELTIEQICQASGFANADTFTRNFRAKFGMTPTAYRGTLG